MFNMTSLTEKVRHIENVLKAVRDPATAVSLWCRVYHSKILNSAIQISNKLEGVWENKNIFFNISKHLRFNCLFWIDEIQTQYFHICDSNLLNLNRLTEPWSVQISSQSGCGRCAITCLKASATTEAAEDGGRAPGEPPANQVRPPDIPTAFVWKQLGNI